MNPITTLAAADFLKLYAVLIAGILALSFWRRARADETREAPPRSVAGPDPYEVAYLRGGREEVARVAVVALVERGVLVLSRMASPPTIGPAVPQPSGVILTPIERAVASFFNVERPAADVNWPALATGLESFMLAYEERLQHERLLTSDETRASRRRIAMQAALVIAFIGGWRLFVGISRGRPVGFLVMMGVAGLVGAILMVTSPRLSARGRRYLGELREQGPAPAFASGGLDPMMMAGLFGVAAMSGTEYGLLAPPRRTTANSGDAGTSGCGTTSDSGGGDSGGGGGGDGGGGCGGGCGGCGS